jgi:hypothetical protein
MRVKKSVYFLIFFLPFALIVLAFFLFFSPNANAAEHYIDKNASGSNNGTNWIDAWENFSAIDWGQIQPGDVIYISGGSDSTVYYETLRIEASGTSDKLITIRNSYEPGHNGRVILDGNNYALNDGIVIGTSETNNPDYLYIKGLEVRRFGEGYAGVTVRWACEVITFDSLYVYDNRSRGFHLVGDDSYGGSNVYSVDGYCVDSITIKNCYISTRRDEPSSSNQTDCIIAQDGANYFIHNNFLRMQNINPSSKANHPDVIQAHRTRRWKIYNNYMVADSGTYTQIVILGAWDLKEDSEIDSVIFYNNFIFDTGNWDPTAGDATVFFLRWYSSTPAGYATSYPPTIVIHNTIVSFGPNYYNTRQEYPITYAANNIFAQYGDGKGDYKALIANSSRTNIPVRNFDNNLYYREWADVNWTGWESSLWTGKGKTGRVENWIQWIGAYGGNGIKANPRFEYDFSKHRDVNIRNYTMEDWRNGVTPVVNGKLTSNSPARNKGLNLQSLVEKMGFEWKGINGNSRDASPTIGAYE